MGDFYERFNVGGMPDIRDAIDRVAEVDKMIEELSESATTKEDRDMLTKLHFEKMMRGLFLDPKQLYF